MHKWQEMNPDYEYMLWDNESIKTLKLVNKHVFDLYELRHVDCWNGKSNILRVEILKKYGGIYIDADCEPARPLEDHLLEPDFFTCYASETERGDRINNAVIGSIPDHPLLDKYIAELNKINHITHRSWRQTGPVLFTEVCKGFDITVYPSYYFEPDFYCGPKYVGEFKPYSHHYWGTSKGTQFGYGPTVAWLDKKKLAKIAKKRGANTYWVKSFQERFMYMNIVITIMKNLGIRSVFEVGPGPDGVRLASTSKTMDIVPEFKPDIVHDATITPWPFETSDAVVSLQTFEHFDGKQGKAFKEAYRIAKKCVIISLPYKWTSAVKQPYHNNIDDKAVLKWFKIKWDYKVVIGQKNKRAIYVWIKK
jgi:hypothetical protein